MASDIQVFFFFKNSPFLMYRCLADMYKIHMCTTCLSGAQGDQNRALDPWELELQMLWLPLGCGN